MAHAGFIYHSIGRPVGIPENMSFVEQSDFVHRQPPHDLAPAFRKTLGQVFDIPTSI